MSRGGTKQFFVSARFSFENSISVILRTPVHLRRQMAHSSTREMKAICPSYHCADARDAVSWLSNNSSVVCLWLTSLAVLPLLRRRFCVCSEAPAFLPNS